MTALSEEDLGWRWKSASLVLVTLLTCAPSPYVCLPSLQPATPYYEDEVQTAGYDPTEWTWTPPGGRQGSTTCIPIPSNLTLCQGIRYTEMRLPNLLEHDSLREVTQQANDWIHLLSIRCHPDAQVFLCSLFAPICFEQPIFPCRSLCQTVQASCGARMTVYGFAWPDMLSCDKFPPDNDLCIKVISNSPEDQSCSVCSQQETFASIFDSFCHASFAMRVKIEKTVVVGDHLEISAAKKKTVFKDLGLSKQETKEKMVFRVDNFTRCSCNRTGLRRDAKKLGQFLVMGHKVRDKYVLKFVLKIEKKSCEMKEALEAIKKTNICKNSSQENNNVTQMVSVLSSNRCAPKITTTKPQKKPSTTTSRPRRPVTTKKSQKFPTWKTTQGAKGMKKAVKPGTKATEKRRPSGVEGVLTTLPAKIKQSKSSSKAKGNLRTTPRPTISTKQPKEKVNKRG